VVDIKSAWETRENINILAKGVIGYYDSRSISHGSRKDAQNY
jgi:hypothetical protein